MRDHKLQGVYLPASKMVISGANYFLAVANVTKFRVESRFRFMGRIGSRVRMRPYFFAATSPRKVYNSELC